ncbi:alpha/beta fold hydrolase [Thalassotalea aquiviva]|uniref:alpha/beta fold hydrolase n=1 Tax=Thalassotalea aquiviva TaxID=3242415 RepID=UPI00352A8B73
MNKPLFLITFFILSCFHTVSAAKQSPTHQVALAFDGEQIAYNVYGEGSLSLVFVHGWSCDSRYWQEQIELFAQNYQVITIDLVGHGHSSLTREDHTMMAFAKDVSSVLINEGVNKAILIGHSMGGTVITQAALLSPKQVIGVIGVDTLHDVSSVLSAQDITNSVKPFENNFIKASQNFVVSMFPSDSDPNLVTWVKEDMSSAPKDIAINAFTNYFTVYQNGALNKAVKELKIPLVSINAKLWPTNVDNNQAHINDYKLFYISNTGHFPMLEKPVAFNQLLTKAIEYISAKQ